jgi:hypothetical protein
MSSGSARHGELQGAFAHLGRVMMQRQGVQVGDEHHCVGGVLLGDDRPDRAEVITQVQVP